MHVHACILLAISLPVFSSPVTDSKTPGTSELIMPLVAKSLTPEVSMISKEVAIRDAEVSVTLEKRINMFWLILAGIALPGSPWTMLFGLYSFVRSTMDVIKDCKDGIHLDCIFHGVDAVVSIAFGVYKFRSGVKTRGEHGRDVYGTIEFNGRHVSPHIEPVNGSLKLASLAAANNGTWEHHASFYHGNMTTHHLMYRLAHPDDLGFRNDGSYHHYRVQPTPEYSQFLGKREEDKSNNLVTDYIWKNSNKDVWQDYHDAGNFDAVGSQVANWMEENQSEATCAVPAINVATHGGSGTTDGDNGVIAYGWNNQPFSFNGRAGGWVDSCQICGVVFDPFKF